MASLFLSRGHIEKIDDIFVDFCGRSDPELVPSDDLRYAQVIKKRNGGKLEKVEKRVILETILNKAISQQVYLKDRT